MSGLARKAATAPGHLASAVKTSFAAEQPQHIPDEKSYNGVSGWLLFFTVCFSIESLAALNFIVHNFLNPDKTAASLATAIAAPVIFAVTLVTVVLTILRVKSARKTAVVACVVLVVHAVATASAAFLSGETEISLTNLVTGVVIVMGVMTTAALYWLRSRRVAETLTEPVSEKLILTLASVVGGIAVVLFVIGLLFTLAHCGGEEYDNPIIDESGVEAQASDGQSEEIAIGETIEDEKLGYEVVVKRAIYGTRQGDQKAVAVEIRVENHSPYDMSFSTNSVRIGVNGAEQEAGSGNYLKDNYLSALPSTVAAGGSAEGWIYALYGGNGDDLSVVYNRPSTKLYGASGVSSVISEWRAEVKIDTEAK
jgi:hypothetical protein